MKAQAYKELGLKGEEYESIVKMLGREPSRTELAMFSVEWSEHCGYTKSRKYLKYFPKKGKYKTLVSEDAGGIVVGDTAVIFKIESHNHPSQVEPKQGSATGIGGIIRDIFTCGARPVACLDSLRFGEMDDPYNRHLLRGVVDGIGYYGNCVGVPTVGGEAYFDDSYSGNCLVNAMCIGTAKRDKLFRAYAKGTGNSIIYAGSMTGRDGIGGCSVLASHEFSEGEEKRPTVQIGDPFTEKCLIEATLEAQAAGHIIGIKDMGAAGLTCSISEMASSGDCGIEADISLVPRREEGMEPWEVMMSESQERMLLCVEKGYEEEIINIFRKWDLIAVVIGKVTKRKNVCIKDRGKVCADVPACFLTEPPLYDMPSSDYIPGELDISPVPVPADSNGVLIRLLSSPVIASKRWIYEQYDHMVQVNTVVYPGGDAAVLRIKGGSNGIAVTTDCNGLYCYLNPYRGAQIAVCEAARNLVCTGAEPAGVTDCLNFGSPDNPDVYRQFKDAVYGIRDACSYFNLPVVSGNVSFYNESPKGPIFPTPVIGMVGIVDDIRLCMTHYFKDEGDIIMLLGENTDELGGSEYLRRLHGIKKGDAPRLDIERERLLHKICLNLIKGGLIKSAHDCSEGGVVVCAAESSIAGGAGALLELNWQGRLDALLFGEAQSRIVISLAKDKLEDIEKILQKRSFPHKVIGAVTPGRFIVKVNGKDLINLSLEEMSRAWSGGLKPN